MNFIPFSETMLQVALLARRQAVDLGVRNVTLEIYLRRIFFLGGSTPSVRYFLENLNHRILSGKLDNLLTGVPKSDQLPFCVCPALDQVIEQAMYLEMQHSSNTRASIDGAKIRVGSFILAASMTAAKELFREAGLDLEKIRPEYVLLLKE